MSIKYAILGLLSWKPCTGYDLKKIFEESSSMYWSGNNNQIYKTLVQLQDDGFVTNRTEHQEGSPSKKIYTITDAGIAELKDWVLSTPGTPEYKKPFLIQLSWAELLNNQELFELLNKYENEIKMQLILHQEKTRRGSNSPNRSEREAFLWSMIDENILSSYRNELEWIQKIQKQLFQNELIEEKKKMNYKIVETENLKYIELFSMVTPLSNEQEVLDLLALLWEHEATHVVIHSEALSDDFFKLKTGLAGKLMQKFMNYGVKAAVIIPSSNNEQNSEAKGLNGERVVAGRFKEMVSEANKGNYFRVFSNKEDAEKWLIGK